MKCDCCSETAEHSFDLFLCDKHYNKYRDIFFSRKMSETNDSNKEAAEMNCNLKVGKCLSSGAKTAEEIEAALKCFKEQNAEQ